MSSQNASGSNKLSFATAENVAYLESLYKDYKRDANSVDATWRKFFEGYEFAQFGDSTALGGAAGAAAVATGKGGADSDPHTAKVEAIINAYRRLGHLSADLNPLEPREGVAEDMTPAAHGLANVDHSQRFLSANLPAESQTFTEIMQLLTETYCRKIGADFREMNDIVQVVWFQEQMESTHNKPTVSLAQKKRLLQKLTEAEGFEQFLGRRYIGVKRFSLEGADSLIPLLDVIASDGAEDGVEEICLGMAHRGRLNVLCNFMGKSYELMLKEFEGSEYNAHDIDGDVKYHMGFASEVGVMNGSRMRLYLSPNPSHLEFVNPVVEGFVRARQRLLDDKDRRRVLPVLMHGDSAMMGQGIVAETLNLSQLKAYTTGGTIHIIINNQIGFTTDPMDTRSTVYASEVAKMIRAPVLHVNADDPEAVAWCGKLATAYRQKFQADIIIDLIGYRRHGHNEGDEPAFTQPLMYKQIAKQPTVLTQYATQLASEQSITKADSDQVAAEFRNQMQAAYEAVHGKVKPIVPAPIIPASLQKSMTYRKATRDEVALPVETGVPGKTLRSIAAKITAVPAGFTPHPKLVRVLDNRAKMLDADNGGVKGAVDWGFGELLALASVALEGHAVRFTGQDVSRGTFTSRHAVFFDFETSKRHNSLNSIDPKQAQVDIANSPLSEQGCLGFEFGYSVADTDSLVCWEAQFGDFSNGAQIIIDQFLSASEAKWKQCSSLVLLLPHGHEGQGPEHSSARPERFLQLCGNLNMQVIFPTTPAQHFHALRRQLHREFRKPLIIMTPKSLLRDPLCVSPTAEFEKGRFHEILDDVTVKKKSDIERVIACSGKVYYDLIKARAENKDLSNVPIVRVEQQYPFPYAQVETLLQSYPKVSEIIWTQEEPQNMGSWNFVRGRLLEVLKPGQKLSYVGRKNSGTPAEGSGKAHEAEQKRIIQESLGRAHGVLQKAQA